jgi:hypothetical protein
MEQRSPQPFVHCFFRRVQVKGKGVEKDIHPRKCAWASTSLTSVKHTVRISALSSEGEAGTCIRSLSFRNVSTYQISFCFLMELEFSSPPPPLAWGILNGLIPWPNFYPLLTLSKWLQVTESTLRELDNRAYHQNPVVSHRVKKDRNPGI